MSNIGIIGHGYVGQAVEYGFKENNNIFIYDKFKETDSLKKVIKNSEFIFICLPTPFKKTRIDLSIINKILKKITPLTSNTDKIIIIKSTVIPGTARNYAKLYPLSKFCSNPEFLTQATFLQDFVNADRIIIGADNEEIKTRVTNLYKQKFPSIPIFNTDLTSAEMAKYMANTFFATKVLFANEISDLCQKLNINYNEVKQMVLADKRIGKSHFDVPGHDGHKGFGGKCFPKDIIALMGLYKDLGLDCSLLKTVWKKNLKIREVKDWEEIPFVKS